MQVYHIVSLLLIIEYILTIATPNCSVFHVKFLVQLILNICELFLEPKITMTQFSDYQSLAFYNMQEAVISPMETSSETCEHGSR